MRKRWRQYAAVCLAGGMLAAQISGCSNQTDNRAATAVSAESAKPETDTSESEDNGGTDAKTANPASAGAVTVQLGEGQSKTVEYLAEDLKTDWDENTATGIVLDGTQITVEGDGARVDGSTVVIEKAGTYVVSGKLADGQIRIEADEKSVVRLVLNGAELASSTTSPIYGAEKCKVILTLEAGTENLISDGTEYQYAEGEDEPDAPIFTKGDLTINGSGSLKVYGNYQSGIRSKDNLMVVSGVISIEAQDDGLKGRDSVIIRDGVLDIKSVKDGIKSNNNTDEEKGFIWIDGGQITIAAQDDGIQAETALIINGGEITITESQEALAGKTVDILGGLIKASASDDGINSAASVETEQEKMQNQNGVYTRIAGGEIWLSARADGIDSNGDLYIEGGTLYLSGPTSGGDGILDYNGDAVLTGGTVFAAGSSGMMQLFGENSTQNYLVVYYTETQTGGTSIQLTDDSGNELGSYTPEKDYQAVIVSSPEIQAGSTYHVVTGDDTAEMEVSGIMTVYGTPAGGGMGGRGGGMGQGAGAERPDGSGRPGGSAEMPADGAPRGGGGRRQDGAAAPEHTADGELPPEPVPQPPTQGN